MPLTVDSIENVYTFWVRFSVKKFFTPFMLLLMEIGSISAS